MFSAGCHLGSNPQPQDYKTTTHWPPSYHNPDLLLFITFLITFLFSHFLQQSACLQDIEVFRVYLWKQLYNKLNDMKDNTVNHVLNLFYVTLDLCEFWNELKYLLSRMLPSCESVFVHSEVCLYLMNGGNRLFYNLAAIITSLCAAEKQLSQ